MKRLFYGFLIMSMLVFGFIGAANALVPSAGAIVSQSDTRYGRSGMRLWQVSYTTHSSAGTFTLTTDNDINGWITLVETDPGATAPTADYDITIKNDNGVDLMGGSLTDRHDTATERARPLLNGNYQWVENIGTLAIAVSSAGNSKTIELLIYYMPF